MTKELRRLSIVMLAMFLALFVSTSVIQVGQAANLANTAGNRRALYDSYEIQRGSIIIDGTNVATSVPSDDRYQFQRVYADAGMWAPVTGYFNAALDSRTGIEQAMNADLSGTGSSAFFSEIERILSELSADCAASADLSLTASATRSAADPAVRVILDLDGSTLDMNGHSICVEGAGASLSITNSWGTGVLLQEADVPVLKVSDGSLKVLYAEEEDGYNPVIKCTSHTTGYSPIVVTGGNLRLEGGYYFFNTTARLINSASADYAYVAKECRFNKNPGFTASSCTLDRDHMIGKAKPVTVDGITYNYRYVDNHAAYDTNDGKFKHFTINADGEVAYLSKFNLKADGTMMSSAWDYTSDASCLMDRTQYDAAAANGYPSLSKEEWTYLLKTRSASTINGVPNARFVKCTFQEKRGLLIFPDEFEWPANAGAAPAESAINNGSANYDAVVYRVYANTLIARGCVFLQADGYVTGGVLKNANVAGNYWTSSTRNASDSYVLDFGSYRSSQATSYDLKTDDIPNDDCVSLRPAFK